MKTSPYISNDNRLADVFAAIQVMAMYKFYKRGFEEWADQIVGDKKQAEHWKNIFIQHPEFFRLDETRTKASLVWRRSYPKLFNVDVGETISKDVFVGLSEKEKMRISRVPLVNEDVRTLMQSAIELHSRALEEKKENRWWMPAVIGFAAGLVPFLLNLFFS